MEKATLTHLKIPKKPGVYFFIGRKKEVLYIGKATALKNRIESYFSRDVAEKRSELIQKMVHEAVTVKWTVTDSVLEAILLEANLIRTHKPRYNSRAKDDKSYNHVVITNEEYPRVLVVRSKDLLGKSASHYMHVYGPFTSGKLLKEALSVIRRLFAFYDERASAHSIGATATRGVIDFNRQIGLYPQYTSKREYARTIKHIRLFFEGKKGQIIKELHARMMRCARNEEFEKANDCKKKIVALTHIRDVGLIKNDARQYYDEKTIRIEAYDVAHLHGTNTVGVMTVLEGGNVQKNEYRKFLINDTRTADDIQALVHMLERRLAHPEWPHPVLIVADGGIAQVRAIEKCLKGKDISIPVVGVVKDDHHKPSKIIGSKKLVSEYKNEILLVNAEAHRFAITFHRSKRKIV